MATLTKRTRELPDGSTYTRWRVRWVDAAGKERSRNFKTRAAADSKLAQVSFRLDQGLSAEGGAAILVRDACQAWVDNFETLWKSGKRERSTWKQYDEHVRLHIGADEIAALKLSRIDPPAVQAFARRLEAKLSAAMAHKVFRSFNDAMTFAVGNGSLAANPCAAVAVDTRDRRRLTDAEAEARDRVIIPALHEARAVIEAAEAMIPEDKGRARAIAALICFAGLRISELRGLALPHLRLFGDDPAVKVRQRADQWNAIGRPKSEAGFRTVPLGPYAAAALRYWLPNVTASDEKLLFPSDAGTPLSYSNLYNRLLTPLMIAANLASLQGTTDPHGAPIVRPSIDGFDACRLAMRPRYSFHDFRHVAASLWIDEGANPLRIKEWMGHSSIRVTMDIYGHLWEQRDASRQFARGAELAVLNALKKGGTP